MLERALVVLVGFCEYLRKPTTHVGFIKVSYIGILSYICQLELVLRCRFKSRLLVDQPEFIGFKPIVSRVKSYLPKKWRIR